MKPSGREYGKYIYDVRGTVTSGKPSLFDFGGVSRKVGDRTFFTSGRISGAKLKFETGQITGKFKPEVIPDNCS